jgi:hypothetical protein
VELVERRGKQTVEVQVADAAAQVAERAKGRQGN